MRKIRLLIVGAGGHGQSVAEAAELTGQFDIVGFVDDALPVGALVLGYPVVGSASDLSAYSAVCDQVIVAIGNNELRAKLIHRLIQTGMSLALVVHPRAIVSPRAKIGEACTLMAGAIVGTEARLGIGAIVNCGGVVDHHARVEDFGHLGVNACMAGGTVLGTKAWLQAGCSLGYGVAIPAGTTVQVGEAVDAMTNKYKQ